MIGWMIQEEADKFKIMYCNIFLFGVSSIGMVLSIFLVYNDKKYKEDTNLLLTETENYNKNDKEVELQKNDNLDTTDITSENNNKSDSETKGSTQSNESSLSKEDIKNFSAGKLLKVTHLSPKD